MSKIMDERIVLVKQRISSEALQLLLCFLLASMLYKQFVLSAEISKYLVELIGFFGALLYIVIRNFISGTLTVGSIKKRALIKLSLLYALVSGAIFALMTLTQDAINVKSVLMIITFLVLSVAGYYFSIRIMGKWTAKRLEQLDKQLDDEEKN